MTHFDTKELKLEVNKLMEEEEECKEDHVIPCEDQYKDFDGFTFDGNSTVLGQSLEPTK